MQAGLYAVTVCGNPHVGVFIHFPGRRVKHIIVFANLGKALCTGIIREVIGNSFDIDKSVADKVTILITPVFTGFRRAVPASGRRIDITASVHVNNAAGSRKDDSVVHTDGAVKYLTIFIAIILFPAIIKEAAAEPRQQAGFFIEMIPGDIFDIGRNRVRVSVGNIPVNIQPIGPFLQRYKATEPCFTGHIIFCALFRFAECAAHKLSLIIEGIGQRIDGANAGIHFVIRLIKVIEIRLAALVSNRLPA